MAEQQTCGKGLAERAALPAALGELMRALARNLDVHRTALDLEDENARLEDHAYASLALQYHTIARLLAVAADEMAGYRDLPMAKHDMQAMRAPEMVVAFGQFVSSERSLLDLLGPTLAADDRMLTQMFALQG